MLNERLLRLILFTVVAAIHIALLFFVVFDVRIEIQAPPEIARVMRVTDLSEAPPPPPPPPQEPPPVQTDVPMVEAIAETMVEVEVVPDQVIVAPGTLVTPGEVAEVVIVSEWDDYLPIHRVSEPPRFDEREIMASLVYPPIAQRSGIEGRVILELFVDRNGVIQQIRILQETPQDRGFGEAAIRAFTGKRGTPAYADGEPVATRYRYPVSFRIR